MEFLAQIEASAFAMFVKESGTAYTTALALHAIGLAFLVGISGATAMRILGAAPSMPLAPMEDFFPLMWTGFWINALTGVVLLSLYPTKYFADPTMYIKLAAVALAMLTLRVLRAHVFGDGADLDTAAGAAKAKRLAGGMLAVWLVAITAGRVTAYGVPTKIQTSAAVIICGVLMLAVGRIVVRRLGRTEPTGDLSVTEEEVRDGTA